MPRPTPLPRRQVIRRRPERGQSVRVIAGALGLVPRTVRHLLRRFRVHGRGAVAPSYPSPAQARTAAAREVVHGALRLRREHPTWGAGLVRVSLRRPHPEEAIPAERTLRRRLQAAGLSPAPSGRRPAAHPQRAPRPHEVRPMDAAGKVRLGNGTRACWLRIVDECSGAVPDTAVSPPPSRSGVPATAVQSALRATFTRWGRPVRFRVDSGVPWGSSGDLPPDPALGLLGLAVEVTPDPPRRPQDNGVVERSHGPGKRWAGPRACVGAQDLRQRLRAMDLIQREEYPSLQGRSRLEAYPELKHSGRAYSRGWERKHWRPDLVPLRLAQYAVPRKVDKSGTVPRHNTNHYVGKLHGGKPVCVMLDPPRCERAFTDEGGRQLRTQPAEQTCRQRIETLTVTNRR